MKIVSLKKRLSERLKPLKLLVKNKGIKEERNETKRKKVINLKLFYLAFIRSVVD